MLVRAAVAKATGIFRAPRLLDEAVFVITALMFHHQNVLLWCDLSVHAG